MTSSEAVDILRKAVGTGEHLLGTMAPEEIRRRNLVEDYHELQRELEDMLVRLRVKLRLTPLRGWVPRLMPGDGVFKIVWPKELSAPVVFYLTQDGIKYRHHPYDSEIFTIPQNEDETIAEAGIRLVTSILLPIYQGHP